MHLPEPVLDAYRKSFRHILITAGPSLHDIMHHFGELNDECWLLLNRVGDWRGRYAEALLESDRMICSFWGVRCDVQNGGFYQYFANSSGDFWPDLLRMLELGSDERGLNYFRRVLSIFPNSSPATERSARYDELCRIETADPAAAAEHFELLDGEYYECVYPDDATLSKALLSLDDIDFVPDPERPWPDNGR